MAELRPDKEAERLAALRELKLLDTPPEERFDRVTRLAQRLFSVAFAGLSLVDEHRVWVKSRQGFETSEWSRDTSFEGQVVLGGETLMVPDAKADIRFAENPAVAGPPYFRFYAGHPVAAPSGRIVGTLSLMDTRPREMTDWELRRLRDLAAVVEEELTPMGAREALGLLQEAEAQSQLLLDTAPQAIFSIDLNDTCTYANAACVRTLGCREAPDVVGRRMHPFIHHSRPDGSPLPEAECPILQSLWSGDGRHTGETTFWRADGTAFPVEAWSVPLRRGGEVVGAVVSFLDIAERKSLELAQLRAREAAFELAKMKSQFLANMSHEIRTPLNAVIGMTGLLLDTRLDAQQRECVETVRQAGDAVLGIINSILDFSKIEAGQVVLEAVPVNLRDVVEASVEMLAAKAQAQGVELVASVDPRIPTWVRGDPGRLRQVLTNLVSNAVKFTERGEVLVSIVQEDASDAGLLVRFEVTDTGVGISPDWQGRLFQAFSSTDTSSTRKFGGTGLGLAISKKLVEIMGGEISVDSVPGRGSKFLFRARLSADGAGTDETASRRALAGRRVLVVDDHAATRAALASELRSWGLRAETASGGEEALSVLREAGFGKDPFAAVLVDYAMPEMGGLTLARGLRSGPRADALRVVLLAPVALNICPDTLRAAGIDAFVVKPVKRAALWSCLARLMLDGSTGESRRAGVAPAGIHHLRRHLRILLAEDNRVNQRVVLLQLQKLGYQADVVLNGREAREALSHRHYDMVLMDCEMPEMDGYAATAEIRKVEGADRHTTIIAMTASVLEGDRERCLRAGMDDYLSKPVTMEGLAATLARWDVSVDETVLESLRGFCGEDGLREVIGLFRQDVPERLKEIREAIGAGNLPGMKRVAHAIRGSSGNLGARRLQALSHRMEEMAASGVVAGAPELLDDMYHEYDRVHAALEPTNGASIPGA